MKQKRAGRRKQNQRRWNDKKMIHFFFGSPRRRDVTRELSIDPPLPSLEQGRRGGLARPNTRVRQNSVSSTEVSSFPLFPISLSHLSLSPDRFLLLHLYLLYISPSPPPPPPIHCVCVSAVCRCWQSWISLRFPGAPVSFRCQRWPPARLFQSFLFETETLLLLLLLTKIRTSACCLNVAGQRFVGYG